MIKRSYNQDI